jgi:outer membrane protein insertion porin family
MRRLLVFLLLLSAPVLRAQAGRALVIDGIPVELRGVSDAMAAPAKRVVEVQLGLAGDKSISEPLADDLAFFLQQRYLQLGYRGARVDWKLSGNKAVLLVEEGVRQTIGTITFTGVAPEHVESLRTYLTRQTREREGRLAKALPFVEADLAAGAGLVVRRLQADGHLQAAAGQPVYTADPGSGKTDILLPVTEGPLSVFEEIRIAGDASPLTKTARAKIAALAGQPYSEVRLENLRKDLKGDLQAQGRFGAEVTAVSSPLAAGGRVSATVTVLPGPPFTVTEVRVAEDLGPGAHRAAESIFHAATGQTYAPETIDLLYRRGIDTGIFSRLDVVPVALSGNSLALTIQGEEAKPKTLGFFGGYETFFGPIAGVEARHVNFLDSGDSLGLRAELRGTGAIGSLQWTDPAIFSSRNALSLGVGLENFTFKDYSRTTLAARASLTRQFNRRITAEGFAAFGANEMESAILTPDELGPESYTTQTAGGRLTLDFRDHPLNPKSGWLAGVSVEGGFDQGTAEDVNFVRIDLNASCYRPLAEHWRLAVGTRASALRTSGGVEDLPIDLRLFNGGAVSVRSFAEREMGPSSVRGSTPLGGTASTVVSTELSYEVIPNLEVAGFVDGGTLSREAASLFSMDDLRYAVGLGLRYRLPVGPLRIDYGYNPDRNPGEKAGALQVTFGFAF